MMSTLSCWHPDIEEYITAKQTAGVLAHFNMSVLITDAFMDAVKANQQWDLVFPDIEADKNLYNMMWDGNIEQWKQLGGQVIIYKSYTNANELYDLIMQSTYNRNEPGVLFIDTINRLNPLYYTEHISATNPCVPAGTEILTDKGYIAIDTVIDQEVNVWNGFEFSKVTPKVTGHDQKLVKVKLSFGQELICTEAHKFVLKDGTRVEAKNLKYGNELIKADFPMLEDPAKDIVRMNFPHKIQALKQQKKLTLTGVETKLLHIDREDRWQLHYAASEEHNKVLLVEPKGKAKEVYCFTEPLRHMGCFEGVVTSNCGEQPLAPFSSCCLGSINVTQYLNNDYTDFDYNKLKSDVHIAVRFLDNVNSVTQLPLKEQYDETSNKRRIGLGLMGYGSALMMLRVRYGSKQALELTHKLMSTITNEGYIASSNIAVEKGSFKLFDKEQYLSGVYIKTLNQETRDIIEKQGLRNSHITTVAPTGNTGVMANNVSGGLEPVFMPEYNRTSICPVPPDGMNFPTNIDWTTLSFKCNEGPVNWERHKEGDVNMLTGKFNNKTYKIDSVRGLCEETLIEDYATQNLKSRNLWDATADWAATTTVLSVDEHIDTMEVFSKYLCSSASKTINLPNEYNYDDFKKTYLKMYETGTIKGGTTYRTGTMTSVLSSTEEKKKVELAVKKTKAPKRPIDLACDIHETTSNGKKYIILVGMLSGSPYEVFAFKKDVINISNKYKTGLIKKVKVDSEEGRKSQYNLIIPGVVTIENICQFYDDDVEDTITRLISTSLRHGSDMTFVYEQLNKTGGSVISFAKAISRALKKYTNDEMITKEGLTCPGCGKNNYRKEGGCSLCPDCGYSACS